MRDGALMRLITIVNRYGSLLVEEGKKEGSRLEWRDNTRCLEVYIKGGFTPLEYACAANLAMNVCIEMHIPVIALKRVVARSASMLVSETKDMFGGRK